MLWGYQLNPEEPKAQQLWNQTSWPISFSIVLRVLFDFWYIKLIESASIKMFQVVLIIDTPRATHQFKKKKSSLFEFTCFCPSSFPHSWWLKSWGPHECHCFFLSQMPSTQAVWPFLCIALTHSDICGTCLPDLAALQTHPFHPSDTSQLNLCSKKQNLSPPTSQTYLLIIHTQRGCCGHHRLWVVPKHTRYISTHIRYILVYATLPAMPVPSLPLYSSISHLCDEIGKRLGLEVIY